MNETWLAYAAGYIDGDGCFFIGKIKTSPFFQDTFSIISTHIDNIEWFQDHFEGNINVKQSRQKNRVPSYHFVFTKEGYKFLPRIRPYLIEKGEECDIFLNFRKPSFKESRSSLLNAMKITKEKSNLIPYSIKTELESIRSTCGVTPSDYAYLAGFIDAKCSLSIGKHIYPKKQNPFFRAQLQCNNTKSPFFYWASRRFGGQFHFLDKSHLPNCRNQMLWRVSNAQLLPILEGIRPFLVHKKPICEKMIEFQKLTPIRKGSPSPNSSQYIEFFRPISQAKEAIYHQVRHLNKTII